MRRNGKVAALLVAAALIVICLSGCEIGHLLGQFGVDVPTLAPEEPTVKPTVAPATQPTVPATAPTEPATVPTQPVTEPAQPTTPPTEPSTQPPTDPPTEPVPCSHQYDAVVTEATCTEPGFTSFTCSLCGDSYVDDYTDLAEHRFGQWKVEQEATCTGKGREVCACDVCGATQTRSTEAKGHSYGSWETTQQPTCTKDGAKQRSCKQCGAAQQKAVEATGHAYDRGVVIQDAASCKDTGVKRFTCSRCGDSYDAAVFGDHSMACNTCKYYGTGTASTLHEPGVMCDMEHEVGCKLCDYGYMDMAYYHLCAGVIDESSALYTDTIKLNIPPYSGVLATWSERWHEFADFTKLGIMYGSWSAKDGWEGQPYEMRVQNVGSYEEALAILEDYNTFAAEFAKVYYWKPVEVQMEYREEKQYVRLYYLDRDQYDAYRKQKKNITEQQMQTLANEVIGYTLQKWGIRDGMLVANTLEYLYYMIWNDVARYDQSLRFHTAFDGFATMGCVCDGYSEMFLLYADALGIQAEEVTGRMMGVGHAWNRVIFSDGTKWHVDITNGPILRTADEMRDRDYTWKGN